MLAKVLEIRDEGTLIPALAVDMNPDPTATTETWRRQRYLLGRCGHRCDQQPNILLTHVTAGGDAAWNDPYGWGSRSWRVAHFYIIEHWHTLRDGDVIDVEYILGETKVRKLSEREIVE